MTHPANSSSRIARGGKALYGAPLGILMLEARFPRIPGDMGNGTTWPFPVLYRVVSGASPEKVVLQGRGRAAAGFHRCREGPGAARRRGHHHQLRFPVAVPEGARGRGRRARCDLVPDAGAVGAGDTAAGQARRPRHGVGLDITPAHLEGAGVPLDTPLVGTENGREFFRVLIKAEKDDMDVALAEQDVVEAGKELVARHPEVGAIVLECTNMPPYAAALQAEVGLPVYDIYSMITWFHAGLRPRVVWLIARPKSL